MSACASRGCSWTSENHTHPPHEIDRLDVGILFAVILSAAAVAAGARLNRTSRGD